ncbi:MAG: glycosyltransferase [Candidatus Omnitrophica bacterium]|nr:glycosyltransferase [Candidatus Omnitrophota bacterium]
MSNKSVICIIRTPLPSSSREEACLFLRDLVEMFIPITHKIYVVTANAPKEEVLRFVSGREGKIKFINPDLKKEYERGHIFLVSFFIWCFKHLKIQMRMSFDVYKIIRGIDIAFFYTGYPWLLSPMAIFKLFRKKVVILETGSLLQAQDVIRELKDEPFFKETSMQNNIFMLVLNLLENISFFLADYIIPESRTIGLSRRFSKYKKKILPPLARFVRLEKFNIIKSTSQKDKTIGYIGRFSWEKGITNFVNAIPLIAKEARDAKFILVGDGPLYPYAVDLVKDHGFNNKVIFKGWVSHQEIPHILNEMKLIVCPSYVEGLSTLLLEAMACGSIAITTPVGGVLDVIKEGETGYLLEDNSPPCISSKVVSALKSRELDKIAKNARSLIEENYTFLAAVQRAQDTIQKIS